MAYDTRPNKLDAMAAERGVTVKELLTEALVNGKGKSGAARLLGLNVNSIRNKVKRLGLVVEWDGQVTVSEQGIVDAHA